VQIGIDPRRAIALTGMASASVLLGLLDGTRERDEVVAAARQQGVAPDVTERVLRLLAAGGVLDDVPVSARQALTQQQRQRLGAELAAAALARDHSDAGATALSRRSGARVRIHGHGRVSSALADILATSGVGLVTVTSPPAPAAAARRRRARRPRTVTGPAAPSVVARKAAPPPDLAVLVGYRALAGGRGPDLPDRLLRAGVPHLAVTAEEAIGVVGPLVRPGGTACVRCVHLTRSALDPAWPLILAQLGRLAPDPPACDAALAAHVAAQAAGQVLAFLDLAPGHPPAPARSRAPAENGTLEFVLPSWEWRRRTWPPHPACPCGAAGSGGQKGP
jgi:hypothetical protein